MNTADNQHLLQYIRRLTGDLQNKPSDGELCVVSWIAARKRFSPPQMRTR
jgi:hypothetical protein